MKASKMLVLVILLVVIFAITVTSQIQGNSVSVEEIKTCNTIYYNENQDTYDYVTRTRNTYGNCIYYQNYTSCLNTSGPNTDCSINTNPYNYNCVNGSEQYQSYEVIGTQIVTRNTTKCNPKSFIVSIAKGAATEKKEIDFSSWGPCIYSVENTCLIVTCVSNEDGAFKGQFTDCKGGKSCQKFLLCQDGIKVLYKNSRNDFVEYDPTFYLGKLAIKEAGQ